MDRDGASGQERRGFIDLPRWMDGGLALGASGLFAVGGVLAIVGAIVVVTLGAVGRMSAVSAAWISLLLLGSGVLALVLHRQAERRAVGAGRLRGLPPERTFAVTFPSDGDWVRMALAGSGTGFLVVEEDRLAVRSRWQHPGLLAACWLCLQFPQFARFVPWYLWAPAVTVFLAFEVSQFVWRKERFPWAEVPSVVVRGNRLALEFAVAGDRRDLVVSFGKRDRARLLSLLAAHCRVEEIPEPARPARAPAPPKPRAPPAPRPAPPPRTAIDGKTGKSLDEALRRVRELEGGGDRG